MRIGAVAPQVEALGWTEWSNLIERADQLGVDAVLLRAGVRADPLLLAAALAARTSSMRVVVEIEVAPGLHPIHLAERIAVADQCLAGRLVVALRRPVGNPDPSLLVETLAVLELALASRPFSYQGAHWTIPAQLEANHDATWSQLSVTPSPAQFEVPLWLAGADTQELSLRESYVWLAESLSDPSDAPRSEHAAARGLRPLVLEWVTGAEGAPDVVATVEVLTGEQRLRGVDLAFLPLLVEGVNQLEALTSVVRPRVQLPDLPDGIEQFWESTLPVDSMEI